MKKIIVFSFLLISLISHGQNKLRIKDTAFLFAPTAVGEPDGEKIIQKVGKAGGHLVSSDQKVELIIPEGALTSNTAISIQPITNSAQGGSGKAFRLEPSGIEFQQPVQLIFHYTDKEMEEGSPQLMGIAYQDEKGFWYGLRNFRLDTAAKTITGNITHFSDWSERWLVTLIPEKKRVKVSNEIVIFLAANQMEKASGKPGVNARMNPFSQEFNTKKDWSVNGIKDGNSAVGHIHSIDGAPMTVISRVYKAPAQVPDQNPVEIKVELSNIKPNGDDSMNYPYQANMMRKCKVIVYDNAYEVKMVSTANGPVGSQFGSSIYKDEGSFVVSLSGKEAKIIEKINLPCKLEYKGRCTITLLQPGSGNIHILDAQSIKVTPPKSPGGPAIVQIIFIRAPAILPLFNYDCPQVAKDGRYGGTNAMERALGAGMVPAFPMQVNFEAKEGEQTILKIGEEGGEVYVKFTVKQIKDD